MNMFAIVAGILLGITISLIQYFLSKNFLKRNSLVYEIRTSFAEDGRGFYVYLPSYDHMLYKDKKLKTKEDFENKYVPKLSLVSVTGEIV